MLGRTPGNIVAIKPMKDGVIADFKVTERMLNYFIQKAHGRKVLVHPRIATERMLNYFIQKAHGRKVLVHPRIVIGVPSDITQVEKRAVMDSAYRAKASEVHLVDQAMMAAIGAGLPITEPSGNMVVEIGSAYPLDKPLTMEIKGRNLIEGVPKTLTIDDSEIREALGECVATIVNAIRMAVERTPPELSADISDRGIVLTGGGGLLKNLDKRIREETGLPVSIADDPLACVVLGTGRMLSDFRLLRKISID